MPLVAAVDPFLNRIHGTRGRFRSRGGEVEYLMAKARLGTEGEMTDERRLTKHLQPVRELLSIDRLEFGQLLQRDLDDARVSSELIPYLLQQRTTGASFFPPVTAALLPFVDANPADAFPVAEPATIRHENGVAYRRQQYGDSFAVEILVNEQGEPEWPSLGRLLWSDERARLVVLDGQHRAMALLAVYRTMTDSWGTSEYRVFYEEPVRQLLDNIDDKSFLADVELPVTICWFPDAQEPQQTARTLFVDLNQNARQPSRSRILLLSDDQLLAHFVRRVLDEAKNGTSGLWLSAIEYDSPTERISSPLRWSSLTNLDVLRYAVEKFVFGPDDVIRTMHARPLRRGRPSDTQMRESLELPDLLPADIPLGDERSYVRGDLGNRRWPRELAVVLADRFWELWGEALSLVLSEVRPHAAHIQALRELKDEWMPDSAESRLVYRGIFEGTGLYWSLVDSKTVNLRQVEARWKTWFEVRRAELFLGASDRTEMGNQAFDTYGTIACQLGLLLGYRTLASKAGWSGDQLLEGAKGYVAAVNAALEEGPGVGRRLFITRERPDSLNLLDKLEANDAPAFKYFWLELLGSGERSEELLPAGAVQAIHALALEGRVWYWSLLTRQRERALGVVAAELEPDELRQRAKGEAARTLRARLVTALQLSETQAQERVLQVPQVDEHMLEHVSGELRNDVEEAQLEEDFAEDDEQETDGPS